MKSGHFFAVALFAAMAVGPAFAQQDPTLITGKQGYVILKTDTKFGDTILKPGIYLVENEISGAVMSSRSGKWATRTLLRSIPT
jgi:hypothetical protein